MADLPPKDDISEGRGHGTASSTPRWAKVIGIVVGVLVLLLAIKMLTVGGGFDLSSLHKRFAGVHGG
jgi:hypothetical protein